MQRAARAHALVTRVARKVRRPPLVRLHVPGTEQSVHARAKTSDLAAFRHVFGGAYDFEPPTEPRLVFDLGVNVGYASVYFALRYP